MTDGQQLLPRTLGIKWYVLHGLRGLKAASVVLGLGLAADLVETFFGIGNEGLDEDQGLSVLHTLDVTLVRMEIQWTDGDDPVGSRHLQLEVRIV